MEGATRDRAARTRGGLAAWRRREARRKQIARRRAVALLLVLGVITAGYYGIKGLVNWWAEWSEAAQPKSSSGSGAPAATVALPFEPESFLPASDLDGDGKSERVALGKVVGDLRKVGLVTGPEKSPRLIGAEITVPAFPIAMTDLPRARGVLVLSGALISEGQPKEVAVGNGKALLAAGGEPDYHAWRLDKEKGLVPVNYYELAAPLQPPAPTAIVVDKWLNALWYYEENKLVSTYRVATGRHLEGPKITAANAMQNYLTPLGRFTIANKEAGRPYYKESIPAGDPRNPLGTRWMGFSVYEGDRASIWAIHGTNEPAQIGRWMSDGCIRMKNADVEALYERVKVGTVLEIISSKGR